MTGALQWLYHPEIQLGRISSHVLTHLSTRAEVWYDWTPKICHPNTKTPGGYIWMSRVALLLVAAQLLASLFFFGSLVVAAVVRWPSVPLGPQGAKARKDRRSWVSLAVQLGVSPSQDEIVRNIITFFWGGGGHTGHIPTPKVRWFHGNISKASCTKGFWNLQGVFFSKISGKTFVKNKNRAVFASVTESR